MASEQPKKEHKHSGGLTVRESLALGCGMNARGSTEVIIATIGLSMGVLSQSLYTVIVAMAVITTMAMPPTLRWALRRVPIGKEEKLRLEREELDEKGFVTNLERLLLAADDSPNGKLNASVSGVYSGNFEPTGYRARYVDGRYGLVPSRSARAG